MGTTMNRATFKRMCDENAEWLREKAPEHSLERDHILAILDCADRFFYTAETVFEEADGTYKMNGD